MPNHPRRKGGKTKGVHDGVVAAGQARSGDGVVLADKAVGALLALGGEVAVGQDVAVQALVSTDVGGSKIKRGRRGRRPMCTSLGASPVEALTELLSAA